MLRGVAKPVTERSFSTFPTGSYYNGEKKGGNEGVLGERVAPFLFAFLVIGGYP